MLEPLTTMPTPRASRRTRGLTLLETMVALAVLAILAGLAVPSFGGMLARQRLKVAADDLAMDLAELRFESTRRGVPLHLQASPGADWCYALATTPGCDCRVPQSCQLKTVRAREHPGVALTQAQDLRFEPPTTVDTVGGSALLQGQDGTQLRVGLSPLGRPSVCAPQAPVPGYARC